MKKLTLIITLLVAIALNTFAYQNEPNGFRGIEWGISPSDSSLGELIFVEKQELVDIYQRTEEKLKIGKADIIMIGWCFTNEQLMSVMIVSKGEANFKYLKEILFTKYGDGVQVNQFLKEYQWNGNKTVVRLNYNEISEKCTIIYTSTKLLLKVLEEDEKENIKGVDDL